MITLKNSICKGPRNDHVSASTAHVRLDEPRPRPARRLLSKAPTNRVRFVQDSDSPHARDEFAPGDASSSSSSSLAWRRGIG